MDNQFNLDSNNYFGKMSQGLMPSFPINNNMQQFSRDIARIPRQVLTQDQFVSSQPQKKKKPFGKMVAAAMLIAGSAAIVLNKGLSGNLSKFIRTHLNELEIRRLIKASENSTIASLDERLATISNRTRKLSGAGDMLANITPVKDTAFHWLTSKCPPLQKFCDWCSKKVFSLTSRATDKLYARNLGNLDELIAHVNGLNIPAENKAKVEPLLKDLQNLLTGNFGKTARNARWSKVEEGLKDLPENVKKSILDVLRGDKKAKEVFNRYLTTECSASVRNTYIKALENAKKAISYDISDVCLDIRKLAIDLNHTVNPRDTKSRKLLAELFKELETYSGLKGSNEAAERATSSNKINQLLTNLKTSISESATGGSGSKNLYNAKEINTLTSMVDSISQTLDGAVNKGKVQLLLTELKSVLPRSEYDKLVEKFQVFQNGLSKSVNADIKMLDKFAENRVGSVPTDILGLAAMGATGAISIAQGQDKDERVGATLKVGVPLLGAMSTYFYTAAKAFSGFTNLAFGFGTGWILNKIGSAAYNSYQKNSNEKKSMMMIAQNAYNNATSV